MSEQASNEQAVVDSGEASKTKWMGRISIALFVVFVISLLSFGRTPFVKVTYTGGSRINFNLISSLGVAIGVFAFIFVLINFKKALRLTTTKKVLGLIGCVGLTLHTLLAIFLPLSCGTLSSQAVGTAGYRPMAQSGAAQWVIDAKTYNIASTYYLRLPKGFQYTIEYPYRFSQPLKNMDNECTIKIVFPLMKYAYTSGLYKCASVIKVGHGRLVPSRIGVVLFEKQGAITHGRRVALSVDQIKKRIELERASPSTIPSDPTDQYR